MSALAGGTCEIAEIQEFDEYNNDGRYNDSMVAYKYDAQGSEVLSIFYKPTRKTPDGAPNSLFSSAETIVKPYLTLQKAAHAELGGSVDILSTGYYLAQMAVIPSLMLV